MKYGVFERAKEDRKFLSMYYNSIVKTQHFKKAMEHGIPKPSPKTQEFQTEIFNTYDEYLIENGLVPASRQKIASKWGLISAVFSALEENEDIKFKIIDRNKYKGAIKTEKGNYEVTVSQHKKPIVSEAEVADKLYPHIEQLAERLDDEGYNIMVVKNNQITVQNEEGVQTSVKIVKKKAMLF